MQVLDRLVPIVDALGVTRDRMTIAPVDDVFGSPFRVTEAAVISTAAAVAAVRGFTEARTGRTVAAELDARHAAAAFHGERLVRLSDADPQLWDPIAGNHPTADGWIRLHTNLARHRRAVTDVLDVPEDRDAVAAQVARWSGADLEEAIVSAGGVAAAMRTRDEYVQHPQHAAVLATPLVDVRSHPIGGGPPVPPGDGWGLEGTRVLDLSRVIAGPVAGRFLASFGADVIRVDPPLDDGLLLEVETGSGKRRTSIDLSTSDGRGRFERLVGGADVLLEAFRPGALASGGYPDERLRQLSPALVIGHLSAYGDRGPWAGRRGFDSVVQVATGLAHTCGFDPVHGPGKLPAQALDHATGYLLAAGVVAGLLARLEHDEAATVSASLARTGEWLAELGTQARPDGTIERAEVEDLLQSWTGTPWGTVEVVRPIGTLDGRPAAWPHAAVPRTEAHVGWRDER